MTNNPPQRSKLTLSLNNKAINAVPTGKSGVIQSTKGKSLVVEVRRSRVRPQAKESNESANDVNLTASEQNLRVQVLHKAAERAASKENIDVQETQETVISPATPQADKIDIVAENVVGHIIEEPNPNELKHKPSRHAIHGPKSHHKSKDGVDEVEDDAKGKRDKDLRNSTLKLRSDYEKRSHNRISVHTIALEDPEIERGRSLSSIRRAREKARRHEQLQQETEKIIKEVIIPESITVQELANRMAERSVDVIKELMKMGMIAHAIQEIDADTAELLVSAFGHKCKRIAESDVENILKDDKQEDQSMLETRPPIVTIMGHVDHGKTSLLDALRKTSVAAGEAGGITQHIGAYQITTKDGHIITFLDTPGHEAFTEMRARGSKITDIVILVVAADDGVMAQTIEAINHAKAAKVCIIVAINKIDKDGVDPQKIKNALLSHELISEELGGDIMIVEVSAKTGYGLDQLVDSVLLQSEVLDLKANPNGPARGIVVESKVDKGQGVMATLLVQKGTLRKGDILVAGASSGRIKFIINEHNKEIDKALPSTPVEISGLDNPPIAGDIFNVVETERIARDIAEYRHRTARNLRTKLQPVSLEEMFARSQSKSDIKELLIIIKADVNGSIEALQHSILKISNEEVKIKIIHAAVGGIGESDISLASASGAVIIAFNVRATKGARELADKYGVLIYYYSIIYNVVDDIKGMVEGMQAPIMREQYLGQAEIRQVFTIPKIGKIAGSFVIDGIVKRGSKVRLLRDNIVIYEGAIKTLQRFKDDVKEARTNFECGIAIENYDDIKEGDVIESFDMVEEKKGQRSKE